MPHGAGRSGSGGLAGSARAQQGISQNGIVETLGGGGGDVQGILQALRSGQVGAEQILQLLSLLTGGGRGRPTGRQPSRQAQMMAQRRRQAGPGGGSRAARLQARTANRGAQQPSGGSQSAIMRAMGG